MERFATGSGVSALDDARAAGRAAADAATAGLGGRSGALVLVYASVRYDLTEVLAGVRSATGPVPLAGMTSCGHFAAGADQAPGQGVAVLALATGRYRFGVASAGGLLADPEGTGAAVARAAKSAALGPGSGDAEPVGPHAGLVLLTGGLAGDLTAVLSGVHRVAGAAVPVIGGAAGDDWRMERTSVFHDDQVLTDAAVGVWITSPRPLTVTSAHGWTPVSEPLLVTRAEGPTIHEIGGCPAGDVYAEFVRATSGSSEPVDASGEGAFGLGLIEPDGSHLVRGAFSEPDGTVRTLSSIPAYSAVQVMTADPISLLSVVDGVVENAVIHGDESVLLTFDCIARRQILGPDHGLEVARIAKAAGGAEPFGVYTYSEFARAQGIGGVHNATLTTLAL